MLSKTVFTLGLASLFTDVSSEMIYPLLPIFLAQTLGAGALQLGLIEGFAETVAAVLKMYAGLWTDRKKKRKPFILFGYSVSGLARPLIGLATAWPQVLGIRFLDRIGKGVRTSPRDALIADVTPPERRGAAYGLHRAMDHLGAVIGPLVAAFLLSIAHLEMRTVFLLALIPSVIAVIIIFFFIREAHTHASPQHSKEVMPKFQDGWKSLDSEFKRFLIAVFVFALSNSADSFFMLRMNEVGVPPAWIALIWSALHVVKSSSTYWGGKIVDKIGARKSLFTGWFIFSLSYLLFALAKTPTLLIIVFLIYGLYFGFAEPSERALVSAYAPKDKRGSAFGYYHLISGLTLFPASLVFGGIWQYAGAPVAFFASSAMSLVAAYLLTRVKSRPLT